MKNTVDVILQEEKKYHIATSAKDIGEYVILPGDPGRVPAIAKYLDNAKEVAYNREYRTFTGTLLGEKVSVTSTGIGGPSAAIAMEELIMCGAKTFIRIGTSGGMALKVIGGDLVIPTAAVRGDGTGKEYIPIDYPAASDYFVTSALKQAADELSEDTDGKRYHIGVVQSKDSFYGETDPDTMPISNFLKDRWNAYLKCGCLTSEMECATLFSVGLARGVQVGAVLTAIWSVERANQNLDNPIHLDNERAIRCAVGAIRKLIEGSK